MYLKIIILLGILIMVWAAIFIWVRGRSGSGGKSAQYIKWIELTLADMFYNFNEKQIFWAVVSLSAAGALIGFLLPGGVSRMDQRLSIEQAIKYNQEQKFEQAVVQLEGLEKLKSPLVYNELGVAYLGLNNFAQAEKEFKNAVRIFPHYGKAHLNLSALYMMTDRYNEASFAETRARESGNYTVSEDSLYNLSDNIADQMGTRIFLMFFLAFGGYNLPRPIISFLSRRRRKKFDSQLADGLVMISNGLRAGLSLVQAIEMLVEEGKPPISQEFEMVIREHRLGSSLGDSLKHLSRRMSGNDTRIMVNATLILLESGGNLPERFDTLAKTIQERKRVQQKTKSMTAEGETQAWILALLPLVLGLLLNSMNHEVFQLMYTTFLGWMIIALIALMELVGVWWMLKIVRVKI